MSDLITEVLPEPGRHQLWVTFGDRRTHLIDLQHVVTLPEYRTLQLPRLFMQVRVTPGGQGVRWPGGRGLSRENITTGLCGSVPVVSVAELPAAERFRPLLPYLQYLELPLYLRPAPIAAEPVVLLLALKRGELEVAQRHTRAPAEQLLNRLYDLGLTLSSLFGQPALPVLLRRPWRSTQTHCPGQPLLHSMLGCLLYGRPDLVERALLTLLDGSHA